VCDQNAVSISLSCAVIDVDAVDEVRWKCKNKQSAGGERIRR